MSHPIPRNLLIVILILIVIGTPPLTAQTHPTTAPSLPPIDQLITQLSDPDFKTRQRAAQTLWQHGLAAKPALETAAESPDLETRTLAQQLLARFALGDSPNTPASIKKWTLPYAAALAGKRREIIFDIPLQEWTIDLAESLTAVEKQSPGRWRDDPQPEDEFGDAPIIAQKHKENLRDLKSFKERIVHRDAVKLAAAGKWQDAEILITKFIPEGINFEDFVALRARLGLDALRQSCVATEKEIATQNNPQLHRLLSLLYRALDDYPTAIKHAEQSDATYTVDYLLYESRQWSKLADHSEKNTLPSYSKGAFEGRILLWRYYANDAHAFEKTLQSTLATYRSFTDLDKLHSATSLRELQIVAGTGPAFALWSDLNQLGPVALTLLAQEHMDLAIASKKKVITANPKAEHQINLPFAIKLYQLGDKETALQLVGQKDPVVFSKYAPMLFERLMIQAFQTKNASQLKAYADDAKALLGPRTAAARSPKWQYGLQPATHALAELYPNKSETDRSQLLDDLLANKLSRKEQVALAQEVAEYFKNPSTVSRNFSLSPVMMFFGTALRENGYYDDAWTFLEATAVGSNGSAQLYALLEMAIEKSNWHKALQITESQIASQLVYAQPHLLWRKGWLLEKMGETAQGLQLQDDARWSPLGSANERARVASEMTRNNHSGDAEMYALNLRVGTLYAFHHYSNGSIIRSRKAESERNFITAADLYSQAIPDFNSFDPEDTLTYAFTLHRLRSLAFLQSKNLPACLTEAARAHETLPASIDLLVDLLPLLDKQNQKETADKLFQQVWDFNQDILKTYPNSIRHHQRLALLALKTHRNLKEGKAYAETALKLDPLDTPFRTQISPLLP